MHIIQKHPFVVSDGIFIRPLLSDALSYYHLLIDCREDVTLFRRVKSLIDDPHRLFMAVDL